MTQRTLERPCGAQAAESRRGASASAPRRDRELARAAFPRRAAPDRRALNASAAILGASDATDSTSRSLLAVLVDKESSNFELGAAANALGLLRDPRVVDPLLAIAGDTNAQYPDLTRALAVVALGRIGDPSDASRLRLVTDGVNPGATIPAIYELLTIL